MYKLSNLAAEDFSLIFEYTLENFGVKQADNYTENMHRILQLINQNPSMGKECSELSDGLRCYNYQSHSIFYRTQNSAILVIRILHQQMEPLKYFD